MTTTSRLTSPDASPDASPDRLAPERFGQQRIRSRLRAFRTPVRGHAFAANPPGSAAPHAGTAARLAREPDNPADPLAIAVWIEGEAQPPWRIGYLDRGVAARMAPRLDAGLALDARVDGWIAEPGGRWQRPVVVLLPEPEEPDNADGQMAGTSAAAGSQTPPRPTRTRSTAASSGGGLWGRPPGVLRRSLGPAQP